MRIERPKNFEDICIDFPVIKGESMLALAVRRAIEKPSTKPLFIWTMPGNRTIRDIRDVASTMTETVLTYSMVGTDVDSFVKDTRIPFYDTNDGASSDDTNGVVILTEFAKASPEMVDFVINLITGKSPLNVPANWRFIFVSNIEDGDLPTWDYETNTKLFNNREYTTYIPDDEKYKYQNYESKRSPFKKYRKMNESPGLRRYDKKKMNEEREIPFDDDVVFVTPDETIEMIENIIWNAMKDGGIEPDEFILLTDEGLVIGREDEFDDEEFYNAVPAKLVINFDDFWEDGEGEVIIDAEPFREIIEEKL